MKWGAFFVLVAGALITTALPGCGSSDTSSVRAAIASGLMAGYDGLTAEQTRTFRVDVKGNWAVVYDPGDPPGCEPGSLWGEPDGAPFPEVPCSTWVLNRQKNRWVIHSHGKPGGFDPPTGSPKELGDPDSLVWLASGQ